MRLGATSALKTKDSGKRLQNFSKTWVPGMTLRVFYPIYWDDEVMAPQLLVGAIYGHKVNDMQALGLKTTFIPSLCQIDENGDPIGEPDLTYQFSMIAPLFIQGRKTKEVNACNRKPWPDENMHRSALADIEHKYDTKNNLKAVKPVIGKLDYLITTEAVVVPVVDGKPEVDKVQTVSQPLNGTKITTIDAILRDKKYGVTPEDTFIEVEYKFPVDTEKSTSGQKATLSGITPEYKLCNTYPDLFAQIKSRFPMIATDSDLITRRAVKMVDENRIKQAISTYSIMQSDDFSELSDEYADKLCKSTELVHSLGLYQTLPEGTLKAKLAEALAKRTVNATVPESVNPTIPDTSNAMGSIPVSPVTPVAPIPGVPDVSDILASADAALSAIGGNDTMSTHPSQLDMDESELQAVDFSNV